MSSRKILNISMPDELYKDIVEMAKKENKSKGELAKNLLQREIKRSKRWEEIRNLGNDTAVKYEVRSEEDVEDIVHQFREDT